MGTVTEFKALGNEGPSAAYTNGIDDYARGFRAGFFGQVNHAGTADKR